MPPLELQIVDCRLPIATNRTRKQKAGQHQPSGFFKVCESATPELCVTVLYSLSLGFFRFRGLNGISEFSRDPRVSRRPSASDKFFILNFSISDFQGFSLCLQRFSLESGGSTRRFPYGCLVATSSQLPLIA